MSFSTRQRESHSLPSSFPRLHFNSVRNVKRKRWGNFISSMHIRRHKFNWKWFINTFKMKSRINERNVIQNIFIPLKINFSFSMLCIWQFLDVEWTESRKRDGRKKTQIKLDKLLAKSSWLWNFKKAFSIESTHRDTYTVTHTPLIQKNRVYVGGMYTLVSFGQFKQKNLFDEEKESVEITFRKYIAIIDCLTGYINQTGCLRRWFLSYQELNMIR